MSSSTAIEWSDATWNPVTGCDRVSPGCAHCYALELAPRLRRFAQARERMALTDGTAHTPGKWLSVRDGGRSSGPAFGVTLHEDVLEEPLRWRKPRRVFVNSMSDLFHPEVPFDFIARCLDVMAEASAHTFQVLTKRPERVLDFFQSEVAGEGWYAFPENVWMGVTIENRRFVGRADILRDIPADVRFISAEPLLGPLLNELGYPERDGRAWRWEDGYVGASLDLTDIDWLIAGGESGADHRPCDPCWIRELRDECVATQHGRCSLCHGAGTVRIGGRTCWVCDGSGRGPGTAFFFKQWGGRTPKAGGRELDGRTWDEMPARAFPAGAAAS